nr:alpha/beta fold hydrolase [Frigidibacter sp. ROC022]
MTISIPPEREPGELDFPTGRHVDPKTEFFVSDRIDYDGQPAFQQALAREFARRPADNREAVVYVHGFNNTFGDGVLRIAQLAHDFRINGVAVHYAWPSAASTLGYEYDRDSQLIARDALEQLIHTIHAAGARRILIVGHSMGAMLTLEVLRQTEIGDPGSVSRLIKGVVLISPDIDVDLFRSQARRIGKLPQPFAIFVSRKDRALFLSSLISGRDRRLGNILSAEAVSDLDVTVIDVTSFSSGIGHFTPGTSPVLIRLLTGAAALDQAFRGGAAHNIGLLPGVLVSVRNATELVLSPLAPGTN